MTYCMDVFHRTVWQNDSAIQFVARPLVDCSLEDFGGLGSIVRMRVGLGKDSASLSLDRFNDPHMSLPPVGENSFDSLGPGLLASGLLGTIIRELQAAWRIPTTPSLAARRLIRKTERTSEQPAEVHVTERLA